VNAAPPEVGTAVLPPPEAPAPPRPQGHSRLAVDMIPDLGALDDRTEQKLARRAAKAAARRAERAAREEEAARRRAANADRKRARRARVAATVAHVLVRWRTVAPITLVTGFAVFGQFSWGLTELRQDWAVATIAIAAGAAAAFEAISLYVQWHAHDALLRGDKPTAAWLRRCSYLLAGIAAAVNYSHFSDGWQPTPAAVVFAVFSLSSPWLWGLHTRRENNKQLRRQGRIDDTGALFSPERWRHFPWRTLGARRYSIDHGITDPQVAWETYRLERQRRHDDLPAAWQQLALSLLRLEDAQDQAEWAANMVSPIDVPSLERVEDIVAPDLEQVDDNGLSLQWKTAPTAIEPEPDAQAPADHVPADPEPQRPPRRRPSARGNTPAPTKKALRLIADGLGRRELARQCGVSEDTARKWIDAHRNTSEVTQ
jgi:hypothetical protein